MLINDYCEIERREKITRRYAKKYRDEITVFAGLVAEYFNMASYDVVVKTYDLFNDDVFLGNMLYGVMNDISIEIMEAISDGRMTFSEYVIETGIINVENFEEKLKEYREERA